MAPQGVLLATVITLASLSQNNEFTAMKACGISITGITLPIIGASLVVALLILASSEFPSPITNQKMNYIFIKKIRTEPSYGKAPTENLWFKSINGDIWNINSFDPYKSTLEGIIILHIVLLQIIGTTTTEILLQYFLIITMKVLMGKPI